MKKRFSSQELFEIRNAIPVDMLIKDQLQMPSKIMDGVFRFFCPVCSDFQTGVNPATNLARCFCCKKNFNTIDLVMEVKKWGFKESVLFLKTVFKDILKDPPILADLCEKDLNYTQQPPCDMGRTHDFNVSADCIPGQSSFQNTCVSQSSQVSVHGLQFKKRAKTRDPETVRRIFQKMFLDG